MSHELELGNSPIPEEDIPLFELDEVPLAKLHAEAIQEVISMPNVLQEVKDRLLRGAALSRRELIEAGEHEAAAQYDFIDDISL